MNATYKSKQELRQVNCSSCYSINYGKLTYSGHDYDLIICSDCGYQNEVR